MSVATSILRVGGRHDRDVESVLYFAYGSNMSTQRLTRRLELVEQGRVAQLKGYRIAFNKRGDRGGKTNIVQGGANDVVPGVVFTLTRAQFETLSGHEGGYAKRKVPSRSMARAPSLGRSSPSGQRTGSSRLSLTGST